MKTDFGWAPLRNGQAIPRASVPALEGDRFRRNIVDACREGARISAYFGHLDGDDLDAYAILADDSRGQLLAARTRMAEDHYRSITPECPQAHLFERELAEQYGVVPRGHPWLKPVRFHQSYRPGHDAWGRPEGEQPVPGAADFFRLEGEEVHEVAVGPIHAGVIEPGHFRFQCHGEMVYHLEISLGYQHRGAEKRLIGGPNKRSIPTVETVAGDTTIGHATAYCLNVEALAGARTPARGDALRAIALELERMANHAGDLGALANDVGFLPTQAYCGRLRGDFLNLSAFLCGNRFGRGMVRPGGVAFDLDEGMVAPAQQRLADAIRDLTVAANLLWDTSSVMARFENCGIVPRATAEALGLVGAAGRASGLDRDVRRDFPTGLYRFEQVPVSTVPSGDVFARTYLRWLEIQRSVKFLQDQVASLPAGPIREPVGPTRPDHLAVALTEGWRGEVCHVALTGPDGSFARYKIVDPSFHNWIGLAMALRSQQISDFPLNNKSFNLSYCGYDL
jgi:Ni,Fe-hydrogenase III large subunit